jgi:hypothetical protein
MRANWAWCPYHADPQQLRQLFDQSTMRGEAITKQSFIAYLDDSEEYEEQTLADHLQSPGDNRKRLLVHWTEFDVLRRRTED